MRKRVIQQKDGIELDLFRDKPVPFEEARGVTPTADSTGVELLSQLEEQKSLTQHLLEEVISYVKTWVSYHFTNLLHVYRNRLGTFQRMPGGVGGQRCKPLPTRLELLLLHEL